MDKDLKRIVDETIQEVFKDAPEKLIERGVREIQYDICPHCKTEIYEKHEYTEDGGVTWRHSECKGLIARPETPVEQISDWLRPYVKEARQVRKLARKQMGLKEDLMPGVADKDTMDSIKTLGSGGYPQGVPGSGDENLGDKEFGLQENVVGLPPSGEEKYSKQEPGGTMSAVNATTIANEASKGVTEKAETQPLPPHDFVRFMNNMVSVVNMSKVPLKITVNEFTAMADDVNSVKTYNIHIDNG
jgi:hypothetical protein